MVNIKNNDGRVLEIPLSVLPNDQQTIAAPVSVVMKALKLPGGSSGNSH